MNRDSYINKIYSSGKNASGLGLGVMLCKGTYPAFPGDVRNASAYPFPIQYDVVDGIRWEDLVYGTDEELEKCLPAVIASAQRLEQIGCKAIIAECGYFLRLQKQVRNSVAIPVFMSSLLQLPIMQQIIPDNRAVGIVCASRKTMEASMPLLYDLGVDSKKPMHIYGVAEDHRCPEFNSLWDREETDEVACCNFDKAETDFVNLCTEFIEKNPDIGALMFECTGFQPFARAVQTKLDVPIFSWGTLMEYAYSTVVHRAYYGHI